MKRLSLLTVIFLAQDGICADRSSLFADSPCKAAYEYHFLNRAANGEDLIGTQLLLERGADVNGSGYATYPGCVAAIEFSSPLMVAV